LLIFGEEKPGRTNDEKREARRKKNTFRV